MQGISEVIANLLKRNDLNPKDLDGLELSEYEQEIFDSEACKHHQYCEQIKRWGRVIRDLP